MKEFITAAEFAEGEKNGEPAPLKFKVRKGEDVRELTAFYPGEGQIAVLFASTARFLSEHEQIAGTLNFFTSCLDEPSYNYIVDRLLDRRDPFGATQVTSILRYLVEEWTGNPTPEPSGSTPSPSPTGQSSMLTTATSI